MKLSISITVLIALTVPAAADDVEGNVGDLRQGWHVGGSAGGAYLPAGGGVAAGVVRVDFNHANGGAWESRYSPIAYAATSPDQDTFGIGIVVEQRVSLGDVFAIGLGALFAAETTSKGSTPAIGLVATPISLRLGGRHDYELGLSTLIIRETSLSNQNFGGFISIGHLWL